MDTRLNTLDSELVAHRQKLLQHQIYGEITTLENLHVFMQHHVFAVWDFMSLLKALQQRLTCSQSPWIPVLNTEAARFINEIVLGEETDEDGEGGFASHFELYHRAMRQARCDTSQIDRFLELLCRGNTLESALVGADVPASVHAFVGHTFEVIKSGDLPALVANFTFGREDLLPDVFQRIVDELNAKPENDLGWFQYYLQRHIELDGDHHGPMALNLVSSVCGDDDARWESATNSAVRALESRARMWDGMYSAIHSEHLPI